MFSIATFRGYIALSAGLVGALAAFSLFDVALAVGSTPVTVVNPADIAKAEGIQQPYQAQARCNFTDSFPNTCVALIQNPAAQRLVIEFVSGSCLMLTNNNLRVATISTSVGGNVVSHALDVQAPTSVSGSDEQQANISQQVRIYADPLTTIGFNGVTWNSNLDFPCDFSISGQAVAVP